MEWGEACLSRFVGMFAFAVWDARTRELFLARDRLGIKPLYYHARDGRFMFASELKALMAFPSFEREVDPDALPLFLHYQYIPGPRTVFRHTFKLPPGHCGVWSHRGMRLTRYWAPPEPEPGSGKETEQEACAHLDELLTGAVRDRLVSDVPIGALLSGGMDSSLVTALMQKSMNRPVRTFSIGFEDPAYDETPWARAVAARLGTDHTELRMGAGDILDMIPRLPDMYDEPFADPSAVPTAAVCRLARSELTVALSGDGGDEQWCGYARYGAVAHLWKHLGRVPHSVRRPLAALLRAVPPATVARAYGSVATALPAGMRVANFQDKWQKLCALVPEDSLADLYRASVCVWSAKDAEALTGRPLPAGVFEEMFRGGARLPVRRRLMGGRSGHVSAGRDAHEGGSCEHGGVPRGAGAAARPSGGGVRGAASRGVRASIRNW